MRNQLALTALFLVTLPTWAGKRITMESVDLETNKTTAREILIDADRLRTNDGTRSVLFLSKGGNRLVLIDKARNEYREIDQATIQQMTQMMQGAVLQMQTQMKNMSPEQRAAMERMMGAVVNPPGTTVATTTYTPKGSGTVNGFRCTNYDGGRAGTKMAEICAATPADLKLSAADFQVVQKLQEFAGTMVAALENTPMASFVSVDQIAPKGINGYPVQVTSFTNGKATTRQSVKSVADAALTDAEFSTGSATKVDMPTMPGMGRGKNK